MHTIKYMPLHTHQPFHTSIHCQHHIYTLWTFLLKRLYMADMPPWTLVQNGLWGGSCGAYENGMIYSSNVCRHDNGKM